MRTVRETVFSLLSHQWNGVIDVMVEQQGGCIASPLPATFGLHAGTPGVEFLEDISSSSKQQQRFGVASGEAE